MTLILFYYCLLRHLLVINYWDTLVIPGATVYQGITQDGKISSFEPEPQKKKKRFTASRVLISVCLHMIWLTTLHDEQMEKTCVISTMHMVRSTPSYIGIQV